MLVVPQRAGGDDRPAPLALRGEVVPPIVVAEDGVDAKRRLEGGELRRQFGHADGPRREAVARHVIAEQHNQVRGERVRR